MSIKTVGFIGIGNMGRPMAANLVKGGYQVLVYDLDAKRAQLAAKDIGAKSAATLAELGAQVDAIVTMDRPGIWLLGEVDATRRAAGQTRPRVASPRQYCRRGTRRDR